MSKHDYKTIHHVTDEGFLRFNLDKKRELQLNHRKNLLQVIFIVATIFGATVKAPPLTYSLSSESTKPSYISQDPILSRNQQIYGEADSQVEVYKTFHYFKNTSLQIKQPYTISVPNPSLYEGDIWIDDLNAEMIENPDAEDTNLARWSDESDGIPDSSRILRLNSTNEYGYVPSTQGDNYFFLCR